MIFSLSNRQDEKLEQAYEKAMKELSEFFGMDWTQNRPHIFVVDSREMINKLKGRETEPWVVGWAENRNIFMLANEKMETESSHKKRSDEQYAALLKHELCHAFVKVIVQGYTGIRWFEEGVAICVSGQNKFRQRPTEFEEFLNPGDSEKEIYKEAGFVVELLVQKFGKQKLLDLFHRLKGVTTKEKFNQQFKIVYGFLPTYGQFNKILTN